MKKLLALTLVVVLVLALAIGCAPKAETTTNPEPTPTEAAPTVAAPTEAPAEQTGSELKDGTYKTEGTADERGYTPEITVNVAGGKITEVKYDEFKVTVKSQDKGYIDYFKSSTKVDLLAAYKAIQESLVANQDPAKIDAYTGATASSDNFKALAAEALKDAKDGNGYKDSTYVAVGKEDERGWAPKAVITVEGGKITKAVYDELSVKTIAYKSQDAAYQKAFKDSKNVDIVAAYNALQASLIAKQDAAQVDAYTGATAAYDSFVELAAKVLNQAK